MSETPMMLKTGLAEMFKGGVIMDVTTADQAKIAEEAGAVAVMALERVPADIRAHGGIARMADPKKIREIMQAVTIPVMAKVRIGHFAEAQILQGMGVDYIDESEVLTPPMRCIMWINLPLLSPLCVRATWAKRCGILKGGNDPYQGRSRFRQRC